MGRTDDPVVWDAEQVKLVQERLRGRHGKRDIDMQSPILVRYTLAKMLNLHTESKVDMAVAAQRHRLASDQVSCWRPSGGVGVGGFGAGAGHMQSVPNAPCSGGHQQQLEPHRGHP